MNNIIDPHLHLFNLNEGDYHWLKEDNPPFWPNKYLINRSFNQANLALSAPLNLAGFVHIEAGFDNSKPEREIAWLESHCDLPFKSIAFADICASDFKNQIQKLQQYNSFVGVRHILDDQAQHILANSNTLANLKLLASLDLIFELQCDCSDLGVVKQLSSYLATTPNLTIIINHCGATTSNKLSLALQHGLITLAQHQQCFIKCSGWEMRDKDWAVDLLAPLVKTIISIFGAHRVMLASNFPLCLFSVSYPQLWQHYTNLSGCCAETLSKLCFENAARVYKLKASINAG